MTMKQYAWRPGAQVSVDPEVAARELDRLNQAHGGLLPAAVVEAARPASAPLHDAFEWDDRVAGEHYRKAQARNLIRSIRIVYEDREEYEPIYFHVRDTEQSSYQPVTVIVQDENKIERVRAELIAKIEGIQRDLDFLANLIGAKADAHRARRTLGLVKERVSALR